MALLGVYMALLTKTPAETDHMWRPTHSSTTMEAVGLFWVCIQYSLGCICIYGIYICMYNMALLTVGLVWVYTLESVGCIYGSLVCNEWLFWTGRPRRPKNPMRTRPTDAIYGSFGDINGSLDLFELVALSVPHIRARQGPRMQRQRLFTRRVVEYEIRGDEHLVRKLAPLVKIRISQLDTRSLELELYTMNVQGGGHSWVAFKLQVIFRKRANNYSALLRKWPGLIQDKNPTGRRHPVKLDFEIICLCCKPQCCLVVCQPPQPCVAVWRSVSQCVAVCCSVLQRVAGCCSVLQCCFVVCQPLQHNSQESAVILCDKVYYTSELTSGNI